MSEESDFEMREEYDLSRAVPSRHAARMTAEAREALHERAAAGTVQAWISHCLRQIQAVEAAMFSYLVLVRNEAPEQAAQTAATFLYLRPDALAGVLRASGISGGEIEGRFRPFGAESRWLVHKSGDDTQTALGSPERALPLAERLQRMATEARALKASVLHLVEQHLARGGLSRQEIEAKTDETAQFWRAA